MSAVVAVAAAVLLAPQAAKAALIGSCSIVVLSAGQMTPNAAITALGSAQPGGTAAQVQVKTNSTVCWILGLLDCYRISAPAPAAFSTYPSGGDAGVTFSTAYRINGGGSIAGSVQTEVLNGTHAVAVDLSAQRASGVFPAGVYRAQVTVRCE